MEYGVHALILYSVLSQKCLLTQEMYMSALQIANSDIVENLRYLPFLINEHRDYQHFGYALKCVLSHPSKYQVQEILSFLLGLLTVFAEELSQIDDMMYEHNTIEQLVSLTRNNLGKGSFDSLCELVCLLLSSSTQ